MNDRCRKSVSFIPGEIVTIGAGWAIPIYAQVDEEFGMSMKISTINDGTVAVVISTLIKKPHNTEFVYILTTLPDNSVVMGWVSWPYLYAVGR